MRSVHRLHKMEDIHLKLNFSSMLDSFVCFLGVGKGCKIHYVILWVELLLEVTKDLHPVFLQPGFLQLLLQV